MIEEFLSKNLESGTYIVGIANKGAVSNYRMAITTTKVGFGGCPILSEYTVDIFVNGELNASDCFGLDGRTTLIDYYEFTIDVVSTVTISLNEGEVNPL